MGRNDLVGPPAACPSVGLSLQTWAMEGGLVTTSSLLSYPEATEETPHTDRQDPFIFSSIQPFLLVRASAFSLSTSCSNQAASSDPGLAHQSVPFLWPQ